MTSQKTEAPPDWEDFFWPPVAELQVEAGFIEAPEERVREIAAGLFRAANPRMTHDHEIAALALAAKETRQRKTGLLRHFHRSDALETVVSSERIAQPHRWLRAAGWMTGILGVGLLIPVPLVAAAAVEDSLLLDRVIAEPAWALAYGFAPIGAVLAAHGIRDALANDRARRWFDLAVYAGAIGAFGAWITQFGPTFLTDVLADPSAAAATAGSLSDFYQYHLGLEVFGAAAAYSAATHLLTAGARRFAKISEARTVLKPAIDAETQTVMAVAQSQDRIAAMPDRYDAALAAYQDHCVLKVEVAKKLFAAKSAGESLKTFAALRAALLTPNTGEKHA